MRILMLAGACLAVLTTAACDKAAKPAEAPKVEPAATAPAEAPVLTPAPSTEAAPDKADASKSPAPQTRAAAYTPVPITRDDQPGRARQIRCQVGTDPETDCTFTPLFGDGSFQLDGPDIALRMVISDDEGSLFEVFGPERRVAIGGSYRRDPRDRACWLANEDTPAPSKVCAR